MKRAAHLALGQAGEEQAASYLQRQGFRILARNWRYGRAEIDLVARDGDILVFVEVKTRYSSYYGYPEIAVGRFKQKQLAMAAQAYIELTGYTGECRYDVIAIVTSEENALEHFRDAFYPFNT